MCAASDCKPQKGHKAIDNPIKVIHTKSLKKVWEMHTQYDATNTLIVDCSEMLKKILSKCDSCHSINCKESRGKMVDH